MSKLLIPVSIMLAATVAVIFPGLIGRFRRRILEYWSKLLELVNRTVFRELANQLRMQDQFSKIKSRFLHQAEPVQLTESSPPIDTSVLNCRIQWTKLEEEKSVYDAFSLEICG